MYRSDVKRSSCTDGPVIWFAVTPQQKVPKICFHGCVRVSGWPHLWVCVLVILSLWNITSSVNKIFVWNCWFFGSQIQNSALAVWSVCHRTWTVCTWQGYRPNLQRVLHPFIRPTSTRWDIFPTLALGRSSTTLTVLWSKSPVRPSALLLVLCENLQISVGIAENSPIWYSASWKPSLIFPYYCSCMSRWL